jgi:hypothetical protein
MLNAAPVFSRYTMSRIGSSAIASCAFTMPMTSAFVTWSRMTTKNDSHSQLLAPRVGVNQTFDNGFELIA